MKKIVFLFFTLFSFQAFSQTNFEKKADLFFKQYVEKGLVDYDKLHADPTQLNDLVNDLKSTNTESMSAAERKAFLINAYNIMVIYQVIQDYPVNSPMEIGGFFESKKFTIGPDKYTLNSLENKYLRPTYKDARFHFVLVCGALSCPPITNFAYTTAKLDEQMDQQTKLAMANEDFIRVNHAEKKVYISEIFKWYTKDFTSEKASLLAYINAYRKNAIPKNYTLSYYPYDWTLNTKSNQSSGKLGGDEQQKSIIQTLTPSSLLKKGKFDFVLFNNIYTQNKYDNNGETQLTNRSTFYGGLLQITYGATKSARVNIGIDINIKSVLNDSDRDGNPLKVLGASRSDTSRTAISSIGPRIKFTPFKNINNFSIQSTFTIPIVENLEGGAPESPWLDHNKYTWWNQFFFDKSFFNDKFQIFTEFDLLFRFKRESTQTSSLSTPTSVFVSYFPTGKSTVYSMIQHSPTFQLGDSDTGSTGDQQQNFTQYGFGAKYQVTDKFNLELLWTDFFRATNGGLGVTYNLGLRYVL